MKLALLAGAAAVLSTFAGGAQAADLLLQGVVGRVEVINEARSDIAVDVRPGSAAVPVPRVTRSGNRVVIDGGVDPRQCNNNRGVTTVTLRGGGEFNLDQAPVITVRAPRSLSIVSRNGAVQGRVGSAQDLALSSGGCSNWTVGDVAGTLRLDQSGGAQARAGGARIANLEASGGGFIRTGAVASLNADASGGGRIDVAQADGPTSLGASGGAHVTVGRGRTGLLRANASGAGHINYGGSAQSLDASASGAAHVRVAQVTGQVVRRHASGMGSVSIGGR